MAASLNSRYPTAFVTGASAGLGRAFVEMLLAEGVRVWGTARDVARLGDLATHKNLIAVALDLHDAAGAEAAFARAAEQAGGAFSLVINNAGYGVFADALATDPAVWARQLDAMVGTTLRLAQAALRNIQAGDNGGALVNVTSLAVEFPIPFMSGYNVAKAALAAWSESVAYELPRDTRIAVIDFRPGDYRTGFNDAMAAPAAGMGAMGPMGRISPIGPISLMDRAWARLERNIAAAPPPARAAADLRRALCHGGSRVVRSGSFFQARLAPLLARFAPLALRRAVQRRYFDLS